MGVLDTNLTTENHAQEAANSLVKITKNTFGKNFTFLFSGSANILE